MFHRLRFYIPMVLVIIVAVTTVVWTDYRMARGLLYTSLVENQIGVAREVAALIDTTILRCRETAMVYAGMPLVQRTLAQGFSADEQDKQHIYELFKISVSMREDIDNLMLFNSEGKTFVSTQDRNINVSQRPYFKKAMRGQSSIDSVVSTITGERLLFFTTPVFEGERIVGVVYISISISALNTTWQNYISQVKDYIIRIVDDQGEVLLSSDVREKYVESIRQIPAQAILKAQPEQPVFFTDREERMGLWVPIGGTPWDVLVSLDKDQSFAPLARLLRDSIFINLLSALLILAVVGYLLQKLIGRVREVEARSRENMRKTMAELEYLVEQRTSALEMERSLLRTMFDAIPDLIFYKSADGIYQDCNRAFSQFLGLRVEDILGRTDMHIFEYAPELAEHIRKADGRVMAQRKACVLQEDGFTAEGRTFHVETIRSPCMDSQGHLLGVLGISRDIAQRLAFEQELLRAREQAQAASMAKSDFIANMSHEIRTPMNGIMGLTHLVLRLPDLGAKARDYVHKIDISARSLLRIINDILDFSKIEAGKLEMETIPFDLIPMLENCLHPVRQVVHDKGIALDLALDPAVPVTVVGDPTRLGQIILNLVNNAVKFTHKGGVRVGVTVQSQEDENVVLLFEVSDSGIGIDKEYLPKLFESFSQADTTITRRYGGTGLGLAICKRLTAMMGGDIAVDSAAGQGTTFRFTAVFALGISPCAGSAAQAGRISGPGPLEGKHILLAEDNEINQLIATEILTGYGATVTVATNGVEAVQYALAGGFDAVLMDIQMPEMDGIEACMRIRAERGRDHRWGYLPIIAMTAHAMAGDQEKSLRAGMQAHITKPINPHELFETLIHWMGQSREEAQPAAQER